MAPVSDTEIIYVRLLNEGTDVFRPTRSIPIGGDKYRLLLDDQIDINDETWEFSPGSIVRCRVIESEGEKILLAVELADE